MLLVPCLLFEDCSRSDRCVSTQSEQQWRLSSEAILAEPGALFFLVESSMQECPIRDEDTF